MAYKIEKDGTIVINGWEKGAAPSPHKGLGDVRCCDITTEPGEASVNYKRIQLSQTPITGGTITIANGQANVTYVGTLIPGTWVLLTAVGGGTNYTNGNYYFVKNVGSTNTYQLSATFQGSAITGDFNGTLTFNTLNMAVPVDHAVQNTTTFNSYRYFILDSNGIVWVSGSATVPGLAGMITTTSTWSAISPNANSTGTAGANANGIVIMYSTSATTNKIIDSWVFVFSDSGISYTKNDTGWPSKGGSWTVWKTLNWTGGYPHQAIMGIDQVVYFCDGTSVGYFYQLEGQVFDPTSSSTYVFLNPAYLVSPEDIATRVSQLPTGNTVSLIVGGVQNNLYTYPDAFSNTSGSQKPTNILWLPENNTQRFIQANNFIFIFCGYKGNIYLTNGSSVVPIATVPDYIAGSVNFTQEPYFVWGDAMYLRGRIWFSIKDQTASHTGNCGGIWSFTPTFNYFPQQDSGLSLRIEAHSAAGNGYNGYAPVLFAGQESTAQQVQGAQYVAAWDQSSGGTTSVDFSGTTPYTDGSSYIETEEIPVGTFIDKKTYSKIEYKLAALPATGDSVAINYRTSLGASFASAGTIQTEGNSISGYCPVNFQGIQLLQLQIVLTAASSNSSFVRLKEVYVHPA